MICINGCLDWVFFAEQSGKAERYDELPNMDAGGAVYDGEVAADENCFVESARFRLCPREGQYGIQVPLGAWHSVVVHEPSTILEAKDGAYGKKWKRIVRDLAVRFFFVFVIPGKALL